MGGNSPPICGYRRLPQARDLLERFADRPPYLTTCALGGSGVVVQVVDLSQRGPNGVEGGVAINERPQKVRPRPTDWFKPLDEPLPPLGLGLFLMDSRKSKSGER